MKVIDLLKKTFYRYRHAWVFLYGFIYMPWFLYLEKTNIKNCFIINSPLDNYIPFVEYFVIPYLLWFVFMFIGVMYFFFTDRTEFYQLTAFLIVGMTVFLFISTIFPNGLHLRPVHFPRDNIFTDMVKNIVYANDTSTNVLPSIHVFNSLGVSIAVAKSKSLKNRPGIQMITHFLAVLIISSTMFLKQHSITDVVAAVLLACVIYPFVYARQTSHRSQPVRQPI